MVSNLPRGLEPLRARRRASSRGTDRPSPRRRSSRTSASGVATLPWMWISAMTSAGPAGVCGRSAGDQRPAQDAPAVQRRHWPPLFLIRPAVVGFAEVVVVDVVAARRRARRRASCEKPKSIVFGSQMSLSLKGWLIVIAALQLVHAQRATRPGRKSKFTLSNTYFTICCERRLDPERDERRLCSSAVRPCRRTPGPCRLAGLLASAARRLALLAIGILLRPEELRG